MRNIIAIIIFIMAEALGERFYHLAKHAVQDSNNHIIGSVLSLRDDTKRELEIQRERYIATHDPLTDLFTKQHLYDRIRELIDENPTESYYIGYADIIKIDMLFLRDTQNQSRVSVILRNIIHMMTELGMIPLTEGVETKNQYQMLEQMGCKLFQGYLFAKPMPVEQFEGSFLKEGN